MGKNMACISQNSDIPLHYVFEDPCPGQERSASSTISRSPEAAIPNPRPECLTLRSYEVTGSCVDCACAASTGIKNHEDFDVLLNLFPVPSCTFPCEARK